MTEPIQHKHVWSIILAGGEGERLRFFVQQWLGHHKPKQYCTFTGTRSMFQHTVDRADMVSSPDHRVTVIAKAHQQEVLTQLAQREIGELVVQPENRDTAAGIFLPLTHVLVRDPHATVVVYPSDHFVYPESRFARALEGAVQMTDLLTDNLILITVPPDRIEPEYGWIQPRLRFGCIGQHGLYKVETFVEKPNANLAGQMMLRQGLWNTLILAARVEVLWTLGWQIFPDLMQPFEKYRAWIATSKEESVRESMYRTLPVWNFSSHLLSRVPARIVALELSGVLWSDWGRAERIANTLRRIGKHPRFSTKAPGGISRAGATHEYEPVGG